MSGQMMSYNRYNEYLETMPSPIMPSELPKRKINFSAMVQYAKEHGISIGELSPEEKEKIIALVAEKQ